MDGTEWSFVRFHPQGLADFGRTRLVALGLCRYFGKTETFRQGAGGKQQGLKRPSSTLNDGGGYPSIQSNQAYGE
jgi:hypothetical protein